MKKRQHHPEISQYFRQYRSREIRGTTKDEHVAMRSPFEHIATSSTSGPGPATSVNDLLFIDEEEDYEYAAETTLSSTSIPSNTLQRAAVSLPTINSSSPLSSLSSSSSSLSTNGSHSLERRPTVQDMVVEDETVVATSTGRERNKYYWGKEGKELFKAHAGEFERVYSKTTKVRQDDNQLWTPRQLYLRDTIENGHTPVLETLPIRMAKNNNKNNKNTNKNTNWLDGTNNGSVLDLSWKGLTGARLSSLSHVLSTMPSITHFNLHRNRAQLQSGSAMSQCFKPKESEGMSKVFTALAAREDLVHVDVSDNQLTINAVQTLGHIMIQTDMFLALRTLCLRKCGLSDHHITEEVAEQLSASPLICLDLSSNKFVAKQGALFRLASTPATIRVQARQVQNQKSWKNLETLKVSDNTFHPEDLTCFFNSLCGPKGCFSRVTTIECSMVQVGRFPAVVSAVASVLSSHSCAVQKLDLHSVSLGLAVEVSWRDLAKSLAANKSILWLDLSHNQLSSENTIILGDQLLLNHTLVDFYYRHGNCGRVDNMGFLLPSAIMTTSAIEDAPHGRYETPTEDISQRRHFEHVAGGNADRDYPWETGKWTEVQFQWTPGLSGSGTDEKVYLRLGADRWWPCPMEWNEVNGSFQVWRSLPPGIYKYLFQVGGTEETKNDADMNSFEFADDQTVEPLLDPALSVFGDWTAEQLMVNVLSVSPSKTPQFKQAPPRPIYAYNRRKFDEDEFKDRMTPSFVTEQVKTKKPEKHAHGLIASVFAPRRASAEHAQQYYDLPSRYTKAANADMARMKMGGGIKELIHISHVEAVQKFLRERYSLICHIHRWYGSYGSGSLFAMNMGVFRLFLGNVQLIGEIDKIQDAKAKAKRKKNWPLTENDIVMIFKKAETSQYARKAGDKNNSVGKALDRFEFTEALVRVALRMCASKTNTNEDAPNDIIEALHLLFDNHLEMYSDRSSGNEFRRKFLYISGVDGMLRKRMHLLKSVFHHYASMFSHGSGRNTMSYKEWDTLIKSALRWNTPKLPDQEEKKNILLNVVKNVFTKTTVPKQEQVESEMMPSAEKKQAEQKEQTKQREQKEQKEPEKLEFGDSANFSLGFDLDGDFEEMEEGDPAECTFSAETEDGVPFAEWDETDEATVRAIELIQLRMRRILARMRVEKVKEAKMARIRALRESSQPLQQSDGTSGVPKGQLIRRQSLRLDVLKLSETIRKEQEAEMGKQKEHTDSLIGGLGDLDVRQAFSFSQMLFIDELTADKTHLTFCDFLEGLVRISQTISNTMNKKLEDPTAAVNPDNVWYDANGVIQTKKQTKWGKYEHIGVVDEEAEIRQDVEHVARFELVLDKICTADVGQQYSSRKKKKG